MIKARDRVGCNPSLELGQGIYVHWEKYRARKEKMRRCALHRGVPVISYVAAQKLAYDVDEFAVAGGLVKAPIRVVQGEDSAIDGSRRRRDHHRRFCFDGIPRTRSALRRIPRPRQSERIQPLHGSHRDHAAQKAILCSIISQVTPSESSVIKKMAYEPLYLDHLKNTLGISCVTRVMLHELADGDAKLTVIQMRQPSQPKFGAP